MGFSGFVLLDLLVSALCVTLKQDDQVLQIDNEEEEDLENNFDELENISGVAERKRIIVRQIKSFDKIIYFHWKTTQFY